MKIALIQSDQLNRESALLRDAKPGDTAVLMIEDMAEFTEVPYHKQRLTLILSAMRHFAEELESKGFTVSYARLCDDPVDAIRKALKKHKADTVTVMDGASFRAREAWPRHVKDAGGDVESIANDMFISNREPDSMQLKRDKATRMETFYRRLRNATGILMDGGEPVGGKWNYDKENREPPKEELEFPKIPGFRPDDITEEAMRDVEKHFGDHFGNLEDFAWPVTRYEALEMMEDFFDHRFAQFGTYQDAMVNGEDALYHSLLSSSINIGLLDPEVVCWEAETRYLKGEVPLNSAEGFIRQILGWREFVYQLYWVNMPGYDELNHLDAELPLPQMYWDAETDMHCMAESIRPVIERGLSHHIQRLMITGNFALLAGVKPDEVNRWYWLGFVDAWHWVVTPNVVGMAMFADGGLMGSKPYAASANYINRMSDYCKHCRYKHTKTVGDDACPFNALYWDFLARNKKKLENNPRLGFAYKNLEKKRDLKEIRDQAKRIRDAISG